MGDLVIAGNKQKSELLATSLGKETAILGLPWLKSQKAIINWAKRTLDLDPNQFTDNLREDAFDTDVLMWYIRRDPIDSLQILDPVWISTTNPAQKFAKWNVSFIHNFYSMTHFELFMLLLKSRTMASLMTFESVVDYSHFMLMFIQVTLMLMSAWCTQIMSRRLRLSILNGRLGASSATLEYLWLL